MTTMTTFQGFPLAVRKWFQGLEADNSKAYFSAHREFFEQCIREQMDALLTELASTFGGEVKMFRQNRDVRFSPDKSPYKTNTYGVLYGAEAAPHGLYASVSARGLVAGSGYHAMARDQLERYREHVAHGKHGPELAKRVKDADGAGLDLWGQTLATAPRGYPKEHERIELLRRKSLSLGAVQAFGRGITGANGLAFVTETWRAAAPVTEWLDQHVGPTQMPVQRRGRR